MRKFTLLFLSMFFMMGTLMAQEGAETSFTLTYTNLSSDTPVAKVEYIQLTFSKDVTVTLPEESIIIKNSTTNEEYKITNAMGYGPNAIMYVQKVTESTNEEDIKTYIDEIGTYSYTIPAGVIKSVDGEDFPEYNCTFSIAEPFTVVATSPATGTPKLEQIHLTFSDEIESVQMPNSGLSVVDLYYTNFYAIKNEVIISEDKKTVTLVLENPITTPGTYYLDLYNNVFTSKSGVKNEYTSLAFSVIDPTPSFSLNIKDGERVQEVPSSIEITFKNVNEVKLVDGADAVMVYIPGGGELEGVAALADNMITVTFDAEFTEEGDYTFVIPDGMFTMDGVANEGVELYVTLYTFTITPLQVLSVTPAQGTVNKLERVVVTFNQPVTLSYDENWQMISREIKMTDGVNEYILTYNSSSNVSDQVEYLVNAEWTGYEYACTPIEVEGTYTINLADIVVDYAGEEYIDEWGWPAINWHVKAGSCEGTATWTISADATGIENVEVENGEQVIYDLTGRRVKSVENAGVYIVNGKKVLVK